MELLCPLIVSMAIGFPVELQGLHIEGVQIFSTRELVEILGFESGDTIEEQVIVEGSQRLHLVGCPPAKPVPACDVEGWPAAELAEQTADDKVAAVRVQRERDAVCSLVEGVPLRAVPASDVVALDAAPGGEETACI